MDILFNKNIFDNFLEYGDVLIPHREHKEKEYSYNLNSDLLRSIEFAEKPEIIVLGCSITLGVGLKENDIWSNILSEKLDNKFKIGNISYSGGSAMKSIISFFNIIEKYNYLPKYVLCNFPSLDRFLFISENNKYIKDYYSRLFPIKSTKEFAPFDYNKIIPIEWAYYTNLEYIKMLDIFCKSNNIKMFWSTWSKNDKNLFSSLFKDNFDSYVEDPTIDIFPAVHEDDIKSNNINSLILDYSANEECHKQDILPYGEYYFNCAYDNKKDSEGFMSPHPGVHRHIHWAEFYKSLIENQ
jgi:hypothetical protein